jgi:microtubule-associated protein 1
VEFFRRLRSSCYIVSGNEHLKESVMRPILDALLDGKTAWPDVQVTLSPLLLLFLIFRICSTLSKVLSTSMCSCSHFYLPIYLSTQVTLIPTFDSLTMHEWYQETHERQGELGITVLGSNSTVAMQEETFPACKVEF